MAELRVTIEVPRGGFIKRTPRGSVDFVSPLPSPFNYGSVVSPGAGRSADGDPPDALVLGPRLALGTTVTVTVWGEVDFVDAGDEDPKLVCTTGAPPDPLDWWRVRAFFEVYARLKAGLNRSRGREGATLMRGLRRDYC